MATRYQTEDLGHLNWILARSNSCSETSISLLREFGGFAQIFAASAARQFRVTQDVEMTVALSQFRAAALHWTRGKVRERPLLGDWKCLLDYLRADLAFRTVECVRVLFLNTRNYLIKDEVMWTGTIDECSVHVREVVGRALELGAAAIILAHNHPGGDPKPSRADISSTRAIVDAGKALGIIVHDHIIISPSAHSSMRAARLI
ncbi:MAG: JAB domain-containing protein [Sphingomonas sp.]